MATLVTSINLGDLKRVIEIQKLTSTSDSSGFQQETWRTVCTTRAKVEFDDRLMREIFRDDGVDSTVVKIFTFRYFRELSTRHRILIDGVPHEIYGFNNVNNEGRFHKVWAREICQ